MNQLTPEARSRFLVADLNWLADTFAVLLVADVFAFDPDVHFTLADIDAGDRRSDLVALTTATLPDGVASADPTVFTGLVLAEEYAGCVVVLDTGVEATSIVVASIDTLDNDTPFAGTSSGADLGVTWSPTLGVFKL